MSQKEDRKFKIKSENNIGSNENVVININGFEDVGRIKRFGIEEISRNEVKGRVKKLKNGKSSGLDGITVEIIIE